MPHRRQVKAFGVAPVENKAATTTPLPPIVESHTTAENESVKESTNSPMTMDAKTVLPPISGGDSLGDGSEKVAEVKSSSSLAEPLPPIASPLEVKDGEVTEETSGLAETTELTVKENEKVTKSSSSLAEPLPPIASPSEVKDGEVTEATSGAAETVAELTTKENVTPLPPITPKEADPAIQFGDVYFILG